MAFASFPANEKRAAQHRRSLLFELPVQSRTLHSGNTASQNPAFAPFVGVATNWSLGCAAGARHVLSLYRYPKLIELSTGEVLHMWTELHSGLQDGSIVRGLEGDAKPPPVAFDATRNRYAIVNGDAVTVVEFDRSVLSTGGQSELFRGGSEP